MPFKSQKKLGNLVKSSIFLILILTSCNPDKAELATMDDILKSPGEYHNNTIQTYGFLKSTPTPKLYKNLNDALYTKTQRSIGFKNIKHEHLSFFTNCTSQYLYITGTLVHDKDKGINFTALTEISNSFSDKVNNNQPCHFIFEEKTL